MIKRVQVPARGSLEAAARTVRYQAFREAMQEVHADTLALAHHGNDQAETLLLHLMYGAGGEGLSGMREYQAPVWRPLLKVSRETLREALNQAADRRGWDVCPLARESLRALNPDFTDACRQAAQMLCACEE